MAWLFGNNKKRIEMVDAVYPIGSIYLSTNSTNPSNFLGGGWEAWGSGRVPVGVNTSDTNFNTVEKTGGEATVELLEKNIPNHSHYTVANGAGTASITNGGYLGTTNLVKCASLGCKPTLASTSGFGGENTGTPAAPVYTTAAHNNLQPYITCYMWKRVS